MAGLTESEVEDATLQWLAGLGYAVAYGPDIGPEDPAQERGSYDEVLLADRLRKALARLNPRLPAETLEDVLRKVRQAETPSLTEENRRLHRYLVEGVPVEVAREDGSIGGDTARLIEFTDADSNDWLAVNQFTVIEGQNNRRPDVVLFVNGVGLAVIELKNPGDGNTTLEGAFNQLQTYKDEIPSLFRTNAALMTSDGIQARLGSLTADLERFMPWRTVDGTAIAPKGAPELQTVIEGVFEKNRFLTLIRDFTVFGDTGSGIVKIVAGYHQYHAVLRAVASTLRALPGNAQEVREGSSRYALPSVTSQEQGDRRIGVIWHTQGSGKSLLMAFYAGQIIAHPAMENPTVVVVTDRNDLDDQLFGTFTMCRDLLRQTPQQADSRDDLQKVLTRPSGGVVFTTIQKFAPEPGETDYPVLTDRRNVVVIADEAHRSQYGFRAKVERKTGEISYGFAKYLRDALPNASFIGFTGTPIEKEDVNTPAVFGHYIDVYDINRGVEDGALRLVIVCDMWLTGFDRHAGIDESEAVAVMLEKHEIVSAMFHGFDYRKGLAGSPRERLAALAGAIEWVLAMQQRESARESTEDGKKRAHRRFNDAVLALSKAFALAAASDEARDIRDEVGFFQTVRAALAKSAPGAGKSSAERDLAVQQIVSRAVVSTEIVDILKAAGLDAPDISILSDEFLAEIQGMEKKNLAMEALRKLINGELRSRSRVNVVQTRAFSQRLEEAIARYRGNAITTAEVLQELIGLAKDILAAHRRGEEEGLSEEEIAFYDALAQNESAVEVMGNDHLRVIAHELLNSLKSNASVDWQHREPSRARMRVLVKRILRKHGYPPDLQDAAVQTLLQQAEALSARWATCSC